MIPKAAESLTHLCQRIAMDLIPKAADDYAATDMGFITLMISMTGQDLERFADVHVREEAMMRDICREAGAFVTDEALKRRIASTLEGRSASLKASDLNDRADLTTRLLIDLHAAVEAAMDGGEAWAGPLNDRIWVFLDGYAERRAYEVPF